MNYLVVGLILCCSAAAAQHNTKPVPLKFRTIVAGGLLAGSTTESVGVHIINGFEKEKLFAGIGAGLDYYLKRGVPLFADVRYHFSENRKSVFVYGNAGVHIPWKQEKFQDIISQKTGLYTDAGFGYKLSNKSGDAFLWSIGYSYKHVQDKAVSFRFTPWPLPEPGQQQHVINDYHFNRIFIKFGWMF
jgi:hypothetical protein